jgi:hypothetical protein
VNFCNEVLERPCPDGYYYDTTTILPMDVSRCRIFMDLPLTSIPILALAFSMVAVGAEAAPADSVTAGAIPAALAVRAVAARIADIDRGLIYTHSGPISNSSKDRFGRAGIAADLRGKDVAPAMTANIGDKGDLAGTRLGRRGRE